MLGEVDRSLLDRHPERHLACDPILAQFIETEGFETPFVDGPFGKSSLDPAFVADEESRVTRGYERLMELERRGAVLSEVLLGVKGLG